MTDEELKLNRDLLLARLKEIQVGLKKLQKYKNMETEEYIKDQEKVAASKYELIVLIEAASIICSHIAVKKLESIPDSYSECYKILKKSKILDNELSERLQEMTKFRNLLVHRYHRIDDKKVHAFIQNDLYDIMKFKELIQEYIKQ